jgi:hypothetical protein
MVRKFDVDISAGILEKYGTTDVTALTITSGFSADATLFPARKPRRQNKGASRAGKEAPKEVHVFSLFANACTQFAAIATHSHAQAHTHAHTHTHTTEKRCKEHVLMSTLYA